MEMGLRTEWEYIKNPNLDKNHFIFCVHIYSFLKFIIKLLRGISVLQDFNESVNKKIIFTFSF